ncbi:GT2 family glycosyltransferase [Agromyces ramosus]|uniref:GT2 family glycosyltransferase n=1 Tax=Agromyces ramosus TaxID=33879 RepID=A0A4Q7MMP0_9MICO|nr:glycosyltransferase [Agromyces ramosus]RZS67919.1 GT2 family glycosyltransferase [Agromyces ramosus]
MSSAYPTTVVVPLYGDLPSAERCILSVLETVDLSVHALLVVNDVGPDADVMEQRVLELLEGTRNTRYVRNAENLGFVGTCNRAVGELDTSENDILLLNSDALLTDGALDELSEVLHLAEKHGVVTARSNQATIATIPFRTRSGVEASPERSASVFEAMRDELPRYSIAPVAHGFCFLVRRELISNHGLFDTEFAPGYGEENDFCLRVNGYGYSSVIANRAFVGHEGSKSFASLDQLRIKAEHEELIVERYPFYPAAVRHYLENGMDTADWFADLLVPSDEPWKVLIDLHHMSLIYDGSVRNALTFLSFLQAEEAAGRTGGIEFVVAASLDAIEFFQLDRFGFRVVPNGEVDEIFDLGFSLAPITTYGQILRLDRLCLRWLASHLDIISLRAIALLEEDFGRRQVVLDSLQYADRVIAISQSTLDDTIDYFPALADDLPSRTQVIHQGVAVPPPGSPDDAVLAHHTTLSKRQAETVDAGGYVLVVGNGFQHKQLAATAAALRGRPFPVVIFGSRADDLGDNVVPIQGGLLTDADVHELYRNAALIVYPSAYEGFGLPVAETAQHGRNLVVFDTEVSREVVGALGLSGSTRFFRRFSELAELVDAALADPRAVPAQVRTIDDYNRAILDSMRDVLERPVSIDRVRSRQRYFRATRAYSEVAVEREASSRARADALEARVALLGSRRSIRLMDGIAVRLSFLRPVARNVRRIVSPPPKA